MQPHNSVVHVEVSNRNSPNAVRAGNLNFRSETKQRGRRIARKGRPADFAAGGNVAKLAVLLQAKAAALAPQKRLVVPEATGIETDVAAERAHVAQHWRRDGLCGLIKNRIGAADERRVFDLSQSRQRADTDAPVGHSSNAMQLIDTA